ncbi:MAG: hypothetical protein JRI61_06750 [Deltaproteobacteria bacterium]|nr:hypothetical protein [Deltaproteobacteria bacterium]
MKQKYLILKGDNENELVLQEASELDKGIFTTVFEEKYDLEAIRSACKKDLNLLVKALRTPGFYPVGVCAEKIAKGVIKFFENGATETTEVSFNDVDLLKTKQDEIDDSEDDKDNPVELDELLEDESKIEEENILGNDDIKKISSTASTIKVADDDTIQTDDEP